MRLPERDAKIPIFLSLLKMKKLPFPEPEITFAPPRKWRFDWAWVSLRIALEIEGAVWTQGRHTRGSGFVKDMEKYNAAASRGWLVIRTTWDGLCTQDMIWTIEQTIKLRSAA